MTSLKPLKATVVSRLLPTVWFIEEINRYARAHRGTSRVLSNLRRRSIRNEAHCVDTSDCVNDEGAYER